LLSYRIAVRRGCDLDQPRNLARALWSSPARTPDRLSARANHPQVSFLGESTKSPYTSEAGPETPSFTGRNDSFALKNNYESVPYLFYS
jgi:hypothetical protein